MKKVLIITYYWPPSGGAGVQRWLKFVKYLRDYNWEPVIYTPKNPEAPAIDNSLLDDVPENITVLKKPIWEPYTFYKKFIGKKKEDKINAGFLSESKKPKFTEKISVWVRGNFFIPDARKYWIKPSIKYLTKYLQKNKVDIIVSNGPPHSAHLIALGIKQKLNIPWLADFRDPWTNIDFYDKLKLTSWANRTHKRLENEVLCKADKIVTVSRNWAKDFEKLGAKNIEVITNGFDNEDFNFSDEKVSEYFLLTHIGSLNKDRNPKFLWKVLKEICEENPQFKNDLKIKFIGKTDFSVFEYLKKINLMFCVEKDNYLPHHKVLQQSVKSTILLLLLNNTPNVLGIIPGKIFEYLAARRPILCIGTTNGDSAKIIKESNSGVVIDFNQKSELKNQLKLYYNLYQTGKLSVQSTNIQKFSRKELTRKMSVIFDELVKF